MNRGGYLLQCELASRRHIFAKQLSQFIQNLKILEIEDLFKCEIAKFMYNWQEVKYPVPLLIIILKELKVQIALQDSRTTTTHTSQISIQ